MRRESGASEPVLGSSPITGQVAVRVVRVDGDDGTLLVKADAGLSSEAFRLGQWVLLTQPKQALMAEEWLIADAIAHANEMAIGVKLVDTMEADLARARSYSPSSSADTKAKEPPVHVVLERLDADGRAVSAGSAEDEALLTLASEILAQLNQEVRGLAQELKGTLDRLEQRSAPTDSDAGRADG